MSKIICDICGTEYPETADQCPICGSAKQVSGDVLLASAAGNGARTEKTATKGGHFSNTNVRKRNRGKKVPVASKKPAAPAQKARFAENKQDKSKNQEKDEKTNRGLLVVVWLLLIAVILVLAYIVVQFVLPMYGIELPELLNKPDETTEAAVVDTTAQLDATREDTSVACTGLNVSGGEIVLDAVGRAWLLEVTAEPANTTDTIIYQSADENVAIVSDQGRVTAVGPGKTVITVTCGSVTKQISVDCPFGEETTMPEETTIPEETTVPVTSEEPTTEEPTTEEPTESTEATEPPVSDFGLFKQEDVTLAYKGETFEFETGDLYLSEIEWTSDDPSVATVKNGEVTAVGPGTTVIRGQYNGRTDTCIIRCEFSGDSGSSDNEDNDEADNPDWPYLYPNTDVSIAVGESFELTYVNKDGEWPDIDWESDDSSIASVDGDWVTGNSYGVTTIRGTYNGVEITCIVRVIL